MKQYDKMAFEPIVVAPEGSVLAASEEKACKIDPINVTVDPFIEEEEIEKSFDLSLE